MYSRNIPEQYTLVYFPQVSESVKLSRIKKISTWCRCHYTEKLPKKTKKLTLIPRHNFVFWKKRRPSENGVQFGELPLHSFAVFCLPGFLLSVICWLLCVLLLILLSHLFLPLSSTFRCKNGRRQWWLFWGWGAAAGRLAASLHECCHIRMASPPRDWLLLLLVVFLYFCWWWFRSLVLCRMLGLVVCCCFFRFLFKL